ncbi:MAG TPA: response regulator transcription factor [Bacteroidota bacterium]|jgi:DNA-binding NarL/FixJ family response regulator|nr:response regulator transcription factor [Bacteroidota bacterium]
MSIGIVIADDHKIVREGLRAMLEKQSDFEVLGEAENGRAIIHVCMQLKPQVVIMDIAMPDLNGIEATHQLLRDLPDVCVIGLSMHFDKRYISKMLQAGARGYLRKACASEDVVRAIRTVTQGKYYIGDGTSSITIKDKDQYLKNNPPLDLTVLTPKEKEILQLIAEGNLTKEIAFQLNLSTKTVEKHRYNIMEKLNMHNIADLTKFAIMEGLTTLER